MNGPIFKNERTMASAGSGKTYALTNRFAALILGGADPGRICALTFTRKAAAEFFDKTVMKLAEAAGDAEKASRLSAQMREVSASLPEADSRTFAGLLEKFVRAAHEVRMETIDSFAARYVRFFAAELGIGDEIRILDDCSRDRAESRTIARTLSEMSQNPEAFRDFAETFRLANMGAESKSVLADLSAFVKSAHPLYMSHPDHRLWGDPKTYGHPKLARWDPVRYAELLETLAEDFAETVDKDELKAKSALLDFFKRARPKSVPEPSNKQVKALASHYREHKSSAGLALPKSRGNAAYGLSPNASAAADAMLAMLLDADIELACASLKAVWLMMRAYEKNYRENVRMMGMMTFSDIPYAISGTRFPRELVELRFDSKFSHWLFDEFQDTSRAQWSIFQNLISEAVRNSGGEKTFYYVGDVKQSIYSWRGGDPRLFDEIKADFGDAITDNPQIKTSWRSAPPIIGAVNSVFSDGAAISLHFGKAAAQRWGDIWQDHDVAPPNSGLSGCVSLQTYAGKDPGDAVYEYIKGLRPLERGLTCAVLTRTNGTAEEIVETIRRRGAEDGSNMRAAGELEIQIASDNMAVPALLAFASSAWHPADTWAGEFAMASPLRGYAEAEGGSARAAFLERLQAFGFAKAFRGPAEFLANAAGDEFTKTRLAQFLEMAEDFDAENPRDMDAFLDFARKYKIREGAASDTIQVMSVHKSKGLDFDVVILPELEKPRHGGLRIDALESGEVVRRPSKAAAAFDAGLAAIRERAEDEDAFESLCLHYVAMTRAKRAMHMILKERSAPEDPARTRDFARMLQDIYGAEKSPEPKILEGDAAWAENLAAASPAAPAPKKARAFPRECVAELATADNPLEDFLNPEPQKAFGSCAHAILEKLSQCGCNARDAAESVKHARPCDAETLAEAAKAVERLLENPEAREIFAHQNYWAEKPYVLSNGGKAESGRFDRVNFHPEEDRAEIIDFKSSPNPGNPEHRRQLERYRAALKRLTRVENVSIKVLSISSGKVFEL